MKNLTKAKRRTQKTLSATEVAQEETLNTKSSVFQGKPRASSIWTSDSCSKWRNIFKSTESKPVGQYMLFFYLIHDIYVISDTIGCLFFSYTFFILKKTGLLSFTSNVCQKRVPVCPSSKRGSLANLANALGLQCSSFTRRCGCRMV